MPSLSLFEGVARHPVILKILRDHIVYACSIYSSMSQVYAR